MSRDSRLSDRPIGTYRRPREFPNRIRTGFCGFAEAKSGSLPRGELPELQATEPPPDEIRQLSGLPPVAPMTSPVM